LEKSLKGLCPLAAIFFTKSSIFIVILGYLSPHLCTHNVEMLLKRTELEIPQSLKGPAGIALPWEGDAY